MVNSHRGMTASGLTSSFLVIGLVLCGCERKASVPTQVETQRVPANVCDLLDLAEIQPLIGASVIDRNSSRRPGGAVVTSQCVYVASEASKSVSLVLTQPDPAGGARDAAIKSWEKAFARLSKEGSKRDEAEREGAGKQGREEREEEGRPPRKIEGLGDQAYWTAGSLYVRRQDIYFRLSLGGADSEEHKLEASKALAVMVLNHL